MKDSSGSYHTLIKELEDFKNKYYKIAATKGLLVCSLIGVLVVFSSVVLEGLFHFSSVGRGVLFFGSAVLLLWLFALKVGVPFLKMSSLMSRMSHKEAALLIGKQTDGLKDRLINVLELQLIENDQINLLVSAAVKQKVTEVGQFNFLSALSFKELKKYGIGFSLLLLFASFISVKYSSNVLPPMERIIDFNSSYSPPNPFIFTVNNGEKLSVLENEELTLNIESSGPEIPQDVVIYIGNETYYAIKDSTNHYHYKLKNTGDDFNFHLIDGFGNEQRFNVDVLPKAVLVSETKIISYPSYTRIPQDTFVDLSNIIIPEGSKVYWEIKTKNSSSCQIQFEDTTFLNSSPQSNYQFFYQPKQSEQYVLSFQNNLSNYSDSLRYNIQVLEDMFPSIAVKEINDSVYNYFSFFMGEIEDDYGLEYLVFVYKNLKNDSSRRVPVPFSSGQRAVFNFDFNFESLSLKPGDKIEYYFTVGDNDQIHGSKETSSNAKYIHIPDKKEFKEKRDERRNHQEQSLKSLSSEFKSIQQEMKEIKSSLLDKKKMDWNNQNQLKQLMKKQKKLAFDLEKFKDDLEKKLAFDPFKKEEEIQKKQELLQKMMDEVMSDEMKKMYDELNKLVEEMNKDKVLDQIDDIEFSQENMLKELDRAIEHFKKLAMQEKANEIKQEIEDLIRKQDELNKQTEKKEESLFKKTQEQEKIKEDFHDIQAELMELQEKNQDLENPEDLNTEEKEEEINESLKNSVNELKDNKLKKASKSQQNTKKQLEELAQQLEGLQNNNHQEQEDMETIRLLLEQLVEFSLNQEDLLNKLKKTNMQDPKFVNIGQEQRKLSDEILIIEDSLDALAMRQLMISNKINKEVQYIKRGLKKSIKDLTERKNNQAKKEQQSVVMHTNELGLLLSEILNQMQQGMPGTGQCNKPGGKGKSPGKSLPQNAGQLQKQIEAMKKYLKEKGNKKSGGQKGGGFEQLGRMAAEQAAIKKQLMEMAQELNKDGSGRGNGLKKLIKDVEEIENEIINDKLNQESLLRQEEIKVKLLEMDKAMKEQENDEKRESKEGKEDIKEKNNSLYKEYLEQKKKETEMLKTIPPNLKPYYKNKVNEYFKNMDGI